MNETDELALGASGAENPSPPEPHGLGLRFCSWDAESDADVDAWFRGRTDPEFRRWNTPVSLEETVEDARESLRERARWDSDGESFAFRIVDAETGITLGQIGLNGIDTYMRRAGVGYWGLPEARGRGVATRSLEVLTRWAFAELGLQWLELDHVVGHDASCRVAERGGYAYEGTMRGATFEAERHDAFRDAHLHARLVTDPGPSGIGIS